jgi:ubiquinone/menaquinone biosynthesis C-methylase UbiE
MPVPDASFDAILCTEVFEHIPHPLEALREFQRVTKPGAMLILTAPALSFTHFAPYYFYSGFSRYFYEHYLPKFGFEILEMTFNGNFTELLAQEVLRLDFVAQKYCGKKLRFYERIIQKAYFQVIKRISRSDSSSHELASFGIMIRARKNSK